MGSNGPVMNGASKASKYDPNFTQHCINTIGPKTTPRNRELFSGLIRHLHDWARETELSVDEWLAGTQFLNSIGQISDSRRNEGHRISDVLGLESYAFLFFNGSATLKISQTRRRNRPPSSD
jgi:hypothetical protein